jgi:signal transduction histidine kinase
MMSETDGAAPKAGSPQAVAISGLRQLRRLVPFRGATVMLFDFAADTATILVNERATVSQFQPGATLTLDQYGRQDLRALSAGQVCRIEDPGALACRDEFVDLEHSQGMQSFLRIPLSVEEGLLGALDLSSDKAGFFADEYVEISRSMAGLLASALQQALLRVRAEAQAAELQRRVAEGAEQLQAANREFEAFTHSISHDLRAPLRHLDGFSNLLRERAGDALDGTSRRYMDTIARAARRMGELIDGVLSLSRTGRAEMHARAVQPRPVVDEVLRNLVIPGGRDVEWIIRPMPEVIVDHGLFRVLWINLLSNALKFTRRTQRARIEIGALPKEEGKCADEEAILYVKDNGVGFDMSFSQKLFGAFQRLHSEEEFEGSGMGLATVKKIIDRHGGRVWAEGQPDAGAIVYFTLKRAMP